ncbi:MAG: response regulator, partial [Mycobacterium sp.]|nr:response regulator [Mycobacterium sp.]
FTVVGQAHNAARARESIASLRPNLVLLDIYLPDRPGLDLIRALDSDRQYRPDFLVITAARDMPTVRRAMQLGAVHYLVKPFEFGQLRDRLVSYRDLHERLRAMSASSAADQEQVDRLYALLRSSPISTTASLPKRHSVPTLAQVRDSVQQADEDMSAAEVAAAVGISRPTAQRYLTYLANQGIIELRLRYGGPGRPEQRYRAT